jgi:hypothetical protein
MLADKFSQHSIVLKSKLQIIDVNWIQDRIVIPNPVIQFHFDFTPDNGYRWIKLY